MDEKSTVLAYPDKTKGYINVKSYEKNLICLINAHETEIACISLNFEGSIIATTSIKVRINTNLKIILGNSN